MRYMNFNLKYCNIEVNTQIKTKMNNIVGEDNDEQYQYHWLPFL